MIQRNHVLCLVCLTVLAGCATPYGQMGLLGGVDATPLTSDSEMIAARGNASTRSDRIQQFVLLKAAEDCLARGYAKFAFVSTEDATRRGAIVIPGQTTTSATVTGYGNMATVNATSYTTPGTVIGMIKPGENVTVKFFKADDPNASNGVDAQYWCLRNSHRPRCGRNVLHIYGGYSAGHIETNWFRIVRCHRSIPVLSMAAIIHAEFPATRN